MTPEQARWVIAFFQNLPRGENIIDSHEDPHEDPQLATHVYSEQLRAHDTGPVFGTHDYPELY